jgi:hypothetical protein
VAQQHRSDSERLASIETTVTDLKHHLMGNGQPGQIAQLHGRINEHGKRLASLEKWKWWVMGIGVGIGFGSGIGFMKILEAASK